MVLVDHTGANVPTGIAGLDYVLAGGFAFNQTNLIKGRPGSGKTTLALQFLIEGRDRGEDCMFITISESADGLRYIAASHGYSLRGIELFELMPEEEMLDEAFNQSIIFPSDLELGETVKLVMDRVRSSAPRRIVFGNFSQIWLLAADALRYRRQILALERFFSRQQCTVLLLDNLIQQDDMNLQSIAHCVIRLEQVALASGSERRRLMVEKMRGRAFRSGYHDFAIAHGGVHVFPRLVSRDHPSAEFDDIPASSGVDALDDMLGGGLHRGATTLIRGPSGSGKSAVALQIVHAALDRGEKALFVSFAETRRNFVRRAASLSLGLQPWLDDDNLVFLHVDQAGLSPGELAGIVRHAVAEGTRLIALDSITGCQSAMSPDGDLMLHLPELLTYLNEQGVVTVVLAIEGTSDTPHGSPICVSSLADTVLQIRWFESHDDIRRGLSVAKTCTGSLDGRMRELSLDAFGMRVGPPLHGLRNQLSASPSYAGQDRLMSPRTAPSVD